MTIEIDFDARDFAEKYERQPFILKHNLVNHPLFSYEKLIEAANRLPDEDIEFNAGDVDIVAPEGKKPDHELTPEETINRIREAKTWLGLKKIRQLPEYAELLDEILDALQPHIEPHYPGMHNREGFIFITSPNSTVPYHMDPEHNFLVQIQGDKYFTIWDKADRDILPEEEIEHHYGQTNRKMVLPESAKNRGKTIHLQAGDAMHVPINSPHYVRNGDEVSISLSVTFQTPKSLQREIIYRVNRNIRKAGFSPTPYGTSTAADGMKLTTYRLYHLLRYQRPSAI